MRMAVNQTIDFGKFPENPLLDTLETAPSMDQTDFETSRLNRALGRELPPDVR